MGLFCPLQAATDIEPDALEQAQSRLKRLGARFDTISQTATTKQLKGLKQELATILPTVLDCVAKTEPKLEYLSSELAIFQPGPSATTQAKSQSDTGSTQATTAPLTPEMARKLEELQTRKTSLEGRIANCKLLQLNISELDSSLDDAIRSQQTRRLLRREASLLGVLEANLADGNGWLDFFDQLVKLITGRGVIFPAHLVGATAIALLGLAIGILLGRILRRRLQTQMLESSEPAAGISDGLMRAILSCAANFGAILLAFGFAIAYLTLIVPAGSELPFVIDILYALLAFFAIAACLRALFDPCAPATHYLPLRQDIAIALSRRTQVLALLVLTRWFMLQVHEDGLLEDAMFSLTRQVLGIAWVLNLIWVLWLLRRLERWNNRWSLLEIICMVLFAGPIAAAIGYINLGAMVILGITFTLLLFGLTYTLSVFLSDLFDGLDAGHYRWQRAVRRGIGLQEQQYVPGLGWLRLAVNFALWLYATLLFLQIWDAAEDFTADFLGYFREGFEVAGVTIIPLNLLGAIVLLAALLTLAGWVKNRLNTKWLAKTRMEPSARDALVTIIGYIGAAIAVIIALSFAGIDFSNLAIIAGALSVGLGFGLQNIVNNFVSGLIMLFERPVRQGDWIVVGDTEGYVERISIRTTTIRTFDRADVIVPNSDLISGQVTNWTLGNTFGRIKLSIGVAYGSDVETVIETLLTIAKQHASIVHNHPSISDPSVLFLQFGDSSLDFQLRAIIHDVNDCMVVTSDLNRAINSAFNELGIEIPFPQRDVSFRDPLQVQQDADARADVSADEVPAKA